MGAAGRDGLRRLQTEPAAKDGQPSIERALAGIEQLVAPVDRGAHGALAFGQILGAAGEQRQAPVQPQ